MDVIEKRIESLQKIARLQTIVLAVVICISVYMFDRTSMVISGKINPFDSARQASGLGLDYSYFTLSIFWPLILGVACEIYRILTVRVNALCEIIRKEDDSFLLHVSMLVQPKDLSKMLLYVVPKIPTLTITIYSLSLIIFFSFAHWTSEESDLGVAVATILYIVVFPISLKLASSFMNKENWLN